MSNYLGFTLIGIVIVIDMLVYAKKRKVDDCPNRLFLSYLKTWRDEAGQKESKSYHTYNKAFKSLLKYPLPLQNGKEAVILENFGTKICAMLDKKLKTEAIQRGLTCSEFLEQSRSVHDSWWESLEQQTKQKKEKTKKKQSVKTQSRVYIPQKNSGAYAILITLYRHASNSWLKKIDLQTLAQPLASKSFTIPDHGTHYTAWSSMATLLSKNLVKKFSNPAKYAITEEGKELAAKIESGEKASSQSNEETSEKENICKSIAGAAWEMSDSDSDDSDMFIPASLKPGFLAHSRSASASSSTALPESSQNSLSQPHLSKHGKFSCDRIDLTLSDCELDSEECIILDSDKPSKLKTVQPAVIQTNTFKPGQFCLKPGNFDIILCVDSRELSGDKRKYELRRLLESSGVQYIERVLQVGDFIWLAQEKQFFGSSIQARELVLDYVIERKCMSDLAQSIRDKRFREQKIRLKQCGVKRVIYLAEEMSQIDHQSLPGKTLRQALINTMIVDQIFVKYTADLAETAHYLKTMTTKLSDIYKNLTLYSTSLTDVKTNAITSHSAINCKLLTFDDFNDDSMKSKGLTVNELFLKQLMQIYGMSFHKANAIAQIFPTPLALHKAYQNLSTVKEKENLLSKVKFGLSKRNVGISISRSVYHVFNNY